jgi:hypothetical protein
MTPKASRWERTMFLNCTYLGTTRWYQDALVRDSNETNASEYGHFFGGCDSASVIAVCRYCCMPSIAPSSSVCFCFMWTPLHQHEKPMNIVIF